MVDSARDQTERSRRTAIRIYEELWHQRRPELIDELISPDLVGRLEGKPVARIKEFREHYAAFTSALPDLQVKVEQTIAEGKHVAIRWRFWGTHTGSGLGVPPTGKNVDAVGLTWMEFKDGLLIGGWDSWNMGEFIARLARVRATEIQERHGLTRRQAEVALLMADRRTAKEIGRLLGIRPNTARKHCQDVLTRLGINSRQQIGALLARGRREIESA